jgi:hypothetical protein
LALGGYQKTMPFDEVTSKHLVMHLGTETFGVGITPTFTPPVAVTA